MKRCSKCKQFKRNINKAFMPDCRYSDGFHPACRACRCLQSRNSRIRRIFKIEPEEYNRIISSKTGCEACNRSGIRLVLDHDHLTGKIRGVLCSNCNTALGLLNDDPSRFDNLLKYLGRASLAYA